MLAPAAWLKHQLSKKRAFPPRAEILVEMLRAIDPGRRRAPGAVGSGLISNILSPIPLRVDKSGAGDLKPIGHGPGRAYSIIDFNA
jgi:hypothetical protein